MNERLALPRPLTPELAELIARRFRAIGEPTRIRLLDRLHDGEETVNALAAELGTTQQNVSKHLALLAEAGIVARRRDGNCVRYRIADETVLELCEQVCGSVQAQLRSIAALADALAADTPSTRED